VVDSNRKGDISYIEIYLLRLLKCEHHDDGMIGGTMMIVAPDPNASGQGDAFRGFMGKAAKKDKTMSGLLLRKAY
jgi:hypothetical protein